MKPLAVTSWRPVVAALSAVLVGIGLARFAYTPLLPAVVTAGWFSASDAAYLGAANVMGYLIGSATARPLAARAGAAFVLRGMMLLAALTFFLGAAPVGFAWFFGWRLLSGVAGGALMVLAAPTVLPFVPERRRSLAGGAIFTGVGLGIAASGTLVPRLLEIGLAETWLALGAIALVLTLANWGAWPTSAPPATETAAPTKAGATLKALYASYALNAFGLVPHMVFLVDFVARGLAQGLEAGARYWIVFGLGAMVGPVLAGLLAGRLGYARALRIALLAQAVTVALPALAQSAASLAASSFLVGAFVPGVVPLVLGRTRELVAGEPARRAAWRTATIAFALGQAIGAYALSFLFDLAHHSYALLFTIGAAAIGLALAIDLLTREPRP